MAHHRSPRHAKHRVGSSGDENGRVDDGFANVDVDDDDGDDADAVEPTGRGDRLRPFGDLHKPRLKGEVEILENCFSLSLVLLQSKLACLSVAIFSSKEPTLHLTNRIEYSERIVIEKDSSLFCLFVTDRIRQSKLECLTRLF